MSGKVEIKLNRAGVRELMQSPEMQEILKEAGEQVAQAANAAAKIPGAEYEAEAPFVGRNRANVSVHPANKEAGKDNLQQNTLLKALGSAKK